MRHLTNSTEIAAAIRRCDHASKLAIIAFLSNAQFESNTFLYRLIETKSMLSVAAYMRPAPGIPLNEMRAFCGLKAVPRFPPTAAPTPQKKGSKRAPAKTQKTAGRRSGGKRT
jgi:hypothetical protein